MALVQMVKVVQAEVRGNGVEGKEIALRRRDKVGVGKGEWENGDGGKYIAMGVS